MAAHSISKSRSRRHRRIGPERRASVDSLKTCGWAWLAGGVLWATVSAMLYTGRLPPYAHLAPGQRAPATVIAAVDFECEDMARTELDMREAADQVPPVFALRSRVLQTGVRAMNKLAYRLKQLRSVADSDESESLVKSLGDVLYLLEINLKPEEVLDLIPPGQEEAFLAATTQSLEEIWNRGLVTLNERESAFQGTATLGSVLVRLDGHSEVQPVRLRDLLLPEEALEELPEMVADRLPGREPDAAVLRRLLAPWLTANLQYDPATTEVMRAEARKQVQPCGMIVRAGMTLIERGQPVTLQVLEQLRAHELALSRLEGETERRFRLLGNGVLLLVAILVCGGLLAVLRPEILRDRSTILALALLSLITILACKGLLYLASSTRYIPHGVVEYLLPLPLAPLIGTVLVGGVGALVAGLWTSFAAAALLGKSFEVFFLGFVVTVVAIHAARDVRKRSRLFRAGVWMGLSGVVCALSLAALNQPDLAIVAYQALACLAAGLVSAGLALLLIPLFEFLFSITTDLSLLEYSDHAHPLLQRLAKEAPGTYHHSLMVADLCRNAAAAIGANSLLVGVCAYYHDIGKLTKPEFFSENQQFRDNPHDDLAPSMSTLVITSHVKEGITLALQHRLPRPIQDGIRQHHGTSLISYFYDRARRQLASSQPAGGRPADSRRVNEHDFRYEGPKPSTREFGILMLADAVEAASRSMSKPTPNRIEALVSDITESRLLDGQLDDCGLTLAELSVIKRSFVFTITSMLHSRIEYPQDENRGRQSADTRAGESRARPSADPLVDEEGAVA